MKTINAYLCYDGLIFEDKQKAVEHDADLLGAELDGLLKLFNLDISRSTEHRGLLQLMSRQSELKRQLEIILNILNYQGVENEY